MKRLVTGSLVAFGLLVVIMGLALSEPALAKGEDVTFVNRSTRTQYVVAAFGGETCGEMASKESFSLDPKESKTVDSGDSKVCYCSSPAGKVSDCGDTWKKSKAGRKVEIK